MKINITLSFVREEDIRRAMDEIMDCAVRIENEATSMERRKGKITGGTVANRKREVAAMLDQIANAIDDAKVEP